MRVGGVVVASGQAHAQGRRGGGRSTGEGAQRAPSSCCATSRPLLRRPQPGLHPPQRRGLGIPRTRARLLDRGREGLVLLRLWLGGAAGGEEPLHGCCCYCCCCWVLFTEDSSEFIQLRAGCPQQADAAARCRPPLGGASDEEGGWFAGSCRSGPETSQRPAGCQHDAGQRAADGTRARCGGRRAAAAAMVGPAPGRASRRPGAAREMPWASEATCLPQQEHRRSAIPHMASGEPAGPCRPLAPSPAPQLSHRSCCARRSALRRPLGE